MLKAAQARNVLLRVLLERAVSDQSVGLSLFLVIDADDQRVVVSLHLLQFVARDEIQRKLHFNVLVNARPQSLLLDKSFLMRGEKPAGVSFRCNLHFRNIIRIFALRAAGIHADISITQSIDLEGDEQLGVILNSGVQSVLLYVGFEMKVL